MPAVGLPVRIPTQARGAGSLRAGAQDPHPLLPPRQLPHLSGRLWELCSPASVGSPGEGAAWPTSRRLCECREKLWFCLQVGWVFAAV